MRTALFLAAKDPAVERTGDMAMFNLVLMLAKEMVAVRLLALGAKPRRNETSTVLEKPEISPVKLLTRSLLSGRSVVHERFGLGSLQHAIAEAEADMFVADHSYMAESFLASTRTEPLYVNTVVSESLVWKASHGLIGKLQAPRILRDEHRVAAAAESVGTYDMQEAEEYRAAGINRVAWLDLTLKPMVGLPRRELSAPRLALVGDRQWRPNEEGARALLKIWPQISEGIPGAELVFIGRPAGRLDLPSGARDLGFVPDLDQALASCRGILAPILTGGGVRVKILEAASRGIPIVGTPAAIGNLTSTFGLAPASLDEEFIEAARRLLLDQEFSRAEGAVLYERNVQHWAKGIPQAAVEEWLQ